MRSSIQGYTGLPRSTKVFILFKKATFNAVLVIIRKLILFKSAKIADNSAKIVDLIASVFAYLAASTINITQVRYKKHGVFDGFRLLSSTAISRFKTQHGVCKVFGSILIFQSGQVADIALRWSAREASYRFL